MVDIGKSEHADINQSLLIMLVFSKERLKAINSSTSLSDNVCQYINVNLSALNNIVVRDKVHEPHFNLPTILDKDQLRIINKNAYLSHNAYVS